MRVFPISSQSITKENCYNSRTYDDIDMKIGAVAKLDKRNKAASKKKKKKKTNEVISKNWSIIAIFAIHG